MAHGKTISIFLVDDDPSSRWICELSNWTGIGFKIPKTMLTDSKNFEYLNSPGIYFLVGRSEDDTRYATYIGEAEDVHYRLIQHLNNNKEWQEWNECVAFCSKDSSLNKAKIKYLENSLYNLARTSGRCEVKNGNEPTKSKLSMKEAAETEGYLDNLVVMFGAMGYKFLQKYTPVKPPKKMITQQDSTDDSSVNIDSDTVIFKCTWPKIGCDARGIIVPEGLLVLKDSKIRHGTTESFKNKGYNVLREKLINEGIIVNDVFVKDYLFSSYSAAASVICGNSTNGWHAWINDNNQTIDDYLNSN